MFVSACLGPKTKARSIVVILKGEEGRVAVVSFSKAVVLFQLRYGKSGEERSFVCAVHGVNSLYRGGGKEYRLHLWKVVYF